MTSGWFFAGWAKCTDFPPVGEGHSSHIDDDDDDDVLLMPKDSVPSAVHEEFFCPIDHKPGEYDWTNHVWRHTLTTCWEVGPAWSTASDRSSVKKITVNAGTNCVAVLPLNNVTRCRFNLIWFDYINSCVWTCKTIHFCFLVQHVYHCFVTLQLNIY